MCRPSSLTVHVQEDCIKAFTTPYARSEDLQTIAASHADACIQTLPLFIWGKLETQTSSGYHRRTDLCTHHLSLRKVSGQEEWQLCTTKANDKETRSWRKVGVNDSEARHERSEIPCTERASNNVTHVPFALAESPFDHTSDTCSVILGPRGSPEPCTKLHYAYSAVLENNDSFRRRGWTSIGFEIPGARVEK
jgi:hypothetical protein